MELTSEISADPLSVATALVARGLIPESVHTSMLIPTKENKVKASELVSQVTNKVKAFSVTFDKFLKYLMWCRYHQRLDCLVALLLPN